MAGRTEPYLPSWLRWLLGAITFLGIAILILSLVLGVRAGQQQLEIRSRQQIAIALQIALDFQAQGRVEEAFNAYRSVLVLEPDNPAATDGIQTLLHSAGGGEALTAAQRQSGQQVSEQQASGQQQSGQNQQPQGSTSLGNASNDKASNVPVTASATETALFDEAQSAFQSAEWQTVIDALTDLKASNPQYRQDEVSELLYTAYFSQATEFESRNNVENATAAYDAAIAIHPNPIGAQVGKELLIQYVDILSIDESDHWRMIAALEGIHQVDQEYRDVERRLQAAYVRHGDSLVSEERWCLATDQYNEAADLNVTPGLLSKRNRYQEQCTLEGPDEDPSRKPGAPSVLVQSDNAGSQSSGSQTTGGSSASVAGASVAGASVNATPTSRTVEDAAGVALSRSTATATQRGSAAGTRTATPTATLTPASAAAATVTSTTAAPAANPVPAAVPASAPAGRIVYGARGVSDGRSRLFAQRADGSDSAAVLLEDGAQPAFRGDGARLVYRNTRDDALGLTGFDPATGLSIRFTDFGEDSFPHWSPEGNRIVFASNREGDRRWRIYIVWAEAGGTTTNQSFGETPSWHPIQDLIAYRGCDERGNACGLWTMDGNGGSRKPLTTIVQDSHPAWSPDGRYVVFMSAGRDGNNEVYSLATSSGQVTRLTNSPTIDGIPAVSPNSDWVAFLSDRNGWGIWRVPITGGNAELVAALAGPPGEWQLQTLQWVR